MNILKPLIALIAGLSLTACATIDGVGARILASDVTLFAVTQAVYAKTGVRLDLANDREVDVIYKLADSYAAYKRGDLSEEAFAAEMTALVEEARLE